MPINLPSYGQLPWANELNAALAQLDGQTVVSGAVVGDNLILTRNNGTTVNAGKVTGETQDVPNIVAIFENGLV